MKESKGSRNMPCTLCPIHTESECNCIYGRGDKGGILFLAEAPGREEEEQGKVLVGRSGKLLQALIHDNELNDWPIYLTNVCRCRPHKNRTPRINEVRTCRDEYLLDEVQDVNPQLIIAMGSTPARAIQDNDHARITRCRGQMDTWNGYPVLYTFHPASLFYDRSNKEFVDRDLQKARKYLLGLTEDNSYNVPRSVKVAVGAIDLETNGKLIYTPGCEILLGSLAVGPNLEDTECYRLYRPSEREEYRIRLESLDTIVGHNVSFDVLGLVHHFGWDFLWDKEWIDSVVVFSTAFPRYPNMGLKHLAPAFCGMEPYSSLINLKKEFSWFSQSLRKRRDFMIYNMKDAIACWRLAFMHWPTTEKDITLLNWLNDLTRISARMSHYGIKIDTEEVKATSLVTRRNMLNLEKDLLPVDLHSTKDIRHHIYDTLGCPILVRTKNTHVASLADVALEEIAFEDGTGWVSRYRRYLETKQTLERYFDPFLREADSEGYVHPSSRVAKLNLTDSDAKMSKGGTNTGRITFGRYSTIPRGTSVKKFFVTRYRQDGVIVYADYSTNEMRVIADLANDIWLINVFKQGLDIHRLTAAEILGKPPEDVTEDERQHVGKKVNFAVVYRATGPTCYKQVTAVWPECPWTVRDFGSFIKRYRKRTPQVTAWAEKMIDLAKFQGEVPGPTGRRYFFPNAKFVKHEQRAACNAPVQGGSADINNAAVEIFASYMDPDGIGYPMLTVYDSVLLDCRLWWLREMGGEQWVKNVMEVKVPKLLSKRFNWNLKVPLKADVEIGARWGD